MQKTDTLGNSYPGIFVFNNKEDGNYYNTLQFIQELKLHSPYAKGIETLFGGYYKFFFLDNGMDRVPTGNADPAMPPLYYNGDWRAWERVNTFALYADSSIPYKQWSFNAGLRYQIYHSFLSSPLPPMNPLMPPYSNSTWFHWVNPRLNLSYHFSPDIQIFLQISNSTKPGGFSKFPFADTDTIPYKEEQIYTLELGNHCAFLDQSLKFNTSFYGIIRDKTQAYVGEGYNKSIANIGNAFAFGVDLGISYQNDLFSLFTQANFGYSFFGRDAKMRVINHWRAKEFL